MVLDGQEQIRRRFIKPVFEEIGRTHRGQGLTHTLARAQTQRGLEMLDREIVLTGEYSEKATQIPASGKARVERECTIDQPRHSAYILAQLGPHEGGVGEDARVVLRRLERLPGKIVGLAVICFRRLGPAVKGKVEVAERRPGERRAVMRIDRDRLLEQSQGLENPIFCYWKEDRKRAQVEIVGGEVGGWARG